MRWLRSISNRLHNLLRKDAVERETDQELRFHLEREITQRMDHRFLNYEVEELKGQIPTCENIARVIWNLLEPKIHKGRLHKVRLYETPDLFAECYRNGAHGA